MRSSLLLCAQGDRKYYLIIMKFLIGVLFFFSAVSVLPSGVHAASPLEVSGWIPYWRAATGTQDTLPNLKALTTVHPFVFSVNGLGQVVPLEDLSQEPWASFIAEAKRQNVRVIPTVMWSDGAVMHKILSNQTTRIALEDEITAIVYANDFDGIDLDFEGKWAETKPYFSTFLRGLYQRMGKKWVYCTIESRTPIDSRYEGTPPAGAGVYANDFVEINKYCDRVQIMTYDQGAIDVRLNRARAAPYIPVSDPGWVEKVIELAAKDIPKRKLVIGIPTYGYEFSVSPLTQYGFRYERLWAFNPRYATDLAAQLGIEPVRNAAGELSFIYKADVKKKTNKPDKSESITQGGLAPAATLYSQAALAAQFKPPFNVVWWSDASAVKDKIDLAKRLGVRGVAIFKLDGGQAPGFWDVVKNR